MIVALYICAGTINAQILVKDVFDRTLNDYQVTLVDWQGHLYNPMVELVLSPPSTASFPLNVTVKAEGTSRLMLDYPSENNSTGATKQITFPNISSIKKIFLEIAPDRAGGYGEIESYTLKFIYGNATQTLPIKVIDQDDNLNPVIPLKFDYRYDNINALFNNSSIRAATEAAIKDWFYFFDYTTFDQVQISDETISITGNDWQNHVNVSNNQAYNGYWIFLRSIESPYATGYPSTNGKFLKKNGVQLPGPLHRSSALILHINKDATLFTSLADEDWHLTNPYDVTDIYGLMMHEFGHAVAFHTYWAGFALYKDGGYQTANDVINYQGIPVPIDDYGHIPAGKKYFDRLSGQQAGWESKFPVRRWMLHKLTLLIASKAGWPLREIGPFLEPSIITQSLPGGEIHSAYSATIKANGGGIPFYNWTISNGSLPAGLILNSFTGEISGTITSRVDTYNFTVQLEDYDEFSSPVTKQLSIQVENTSETQVSDGCQIHDSISMKGFPQDIGNYPNPFNPSTDIHFDLEQSSFIELKIYDLIGKEITTLISSNLQKGRYNIRWNAVNVPNGIYFCKLSNGSDILTKKMTLLR